MKWWQQSNSAGQLPWCRKSWCSAAIALFVGGLLVAGLLYAWPLRRAQRLTSLPGEFTAYVEVVKQLQSEHPEGAIENLKAFIQHRSHLYYKVLAALHGAKYTVTHQRYDEAIAQLTAILPQAQDPQLQAILRLRIAKLQWQVGKSDEALTTLENIKIAPWNAKAQALRGDILFMRRELQDARSAYQQALASPSLVSIHPLLQMKINDTYELEEKR